jgi:hypothetical protein
LTDFKKILDIKFHENPSRAEVHADVRMDRETENRERERKRERDRHAEADNRLLQFCERTSKSMTVIS